MVSLKWIKKHITLVGCIVLCSSSVQVCNVGCYYIGDFSCNGRSRWGSEESSNENNCDNTNTGLGGSKFFYKKTQPQALSVRQSSYSRSLFSKRKTPSGNGVTNLTKTITPPQTTAKPLGTQSGANTLSGGNDDGVLLTRDDGYVFPFAEVELEEIFGRVERRTAHVWLHVEPREETVFDPEPATGKNHEIKCRQAKVRGRRLLGARCSYRKSYHKNRGTLETNATSDTESIFSDDELPQVEEAPRPFIEDDFLERGEELVVVGEAHGENDIFEQILMEHGAYAVVEKEHEIEVREEEEDLAHVNKEILITKLESIKGEISNRGAQIANKVVWVEQDKSIENDSKRIKNSKKNTIHQKAIKEEGDLTTQLNRLIISLKTRKTDNKFVRDLYRELKEVDPKLERQILAAKIQKSNRLIADMEKQESVRQNVVEYINSGDQLSERMNVGNRKLKFTERLSIFEQAKLLERNCHISVPAKLRLSLLTNHTDERDFIDYVMFVHEEVHKFHTLYPY